MKAALLLLMTFGFTTFSCSDLGTSDDAQDQRDVRPLTALEQQLVSRNNSFGFRLLRTVNQSESNKNVFLSPFSVAMALGMTLNGAAGSTEEEMKSTLGFGGMTQEEINTTYAGLMRLLRTLDPKVEFTIANSIWHRLGFPVEQQFIDINRLYFEAVVRGINFSAPDAAKTINAWVDKNSKGMIQGIVPDPIPDDVVMYLINAIYFKGIWTYQFDKSKTADAPFYLDNGRTITSKLMQLRGTLPYAESGSYQAIELPYGDSLFAMIVVLPKAGQSLESFVDNLTQESWNSLKAALRPASGTLFLPKFKLAYEKDLNKPLKDMGMVRAFDAGQADFRRISEEVYRQGNRLYISKVKHKSFVQVDEEGTEAAAVTSVEAGITSAGPREFVMRVDRPFFFIITERHSGTLLFAGKVVEPTI
jgi:serpin B